jgi:hypothetical protein
VEVSFTAPSAAVRLLEWGGSDSWPLALPAVPVRVRYCASGMDLARAADTRPRDGSPIDRYLLQFWGSADEGDEVLKQTSEVAAYWHDWARGLAVRTAEELADEQSRRVDAHEQAMGRARELLIRQGSTDRASDRRLQATVRRPRRPGPGSMGPDTNR